MTDLKTIALLQEKATKGPWTVRGTPDDVLKEAQKYDLRSPVRKNLAIECFRNNDGYTILSEFNGPDREHNAQFIAACGSFDFTALCDEMESLKAENRTLRNIAVSRQDDFDKLKNALESIADNTCCGTCQEAALVAKKGLGENR